MKTGTVMPGRLFSSPARAVALGNTSCRSSVYDRLEQRDNKANKIREKADGKVQKRRQNLTSLGKRNGDQE